MRYVDVQGRRAKQARSPRGPAGFWHDVRNNPYPSIAAGLVIGIATLWLFSWWPLEHWGLLAIPSAFLVVRGIWQLGHGRRQGKGPKPGAEKQLLMVLRDVGSISPIQASLETSLTVDEAEEILSRLATRGHLHVEGRDGALFYVLPGGRPSER